MKRILEVQKEIGVLGKDSKNPFFKSAYLDLNKLLIHVTPLLHKHGLVLIQPISCGIVSSEIISIDDNETICSSSLKIPETLTDPQKLGSCITYFRRYTLKSLLSIPEGDDDANLASIPEPLSHKELEECKTLEDLKGVFTKLSKSYQAKYVTLKDE